jgi:hypothetical protein
MEPESKQIEKFDPKKWAKRNCRTCSGDGELRVHVKNPVTGRVEPKSNNIEIRPCGCAIKRYQRSLQAKEQK